eukprot:238475-Amphidinium_carterae.2
MRAALLLLAQTGAGGDDAGGSSSSACPRQLRRVAQQDNDLRVVVVSWTIWNAKRLEHPQQQKTTPHTDQNVTLLVLTTTESSHSAKRNTVLGRKHCELII